VTDFAAEIRASLSVQESLLELLPTVQQIAERITSALRDGHKVLACGNGGSAADAEHLVTELVCRYQADRGAYAALALSASAILLTAAANDYGFDSVFARQVEALAQPGDVVLGISTSGRSASVVRAMEAARARGALTIAVTGCQGGDLKSAVDICCAIPSSDTPRIQEAHRLLIHCVCAYVEAALGAEG
jgi:D-sedoheptulose 7-phosphate isomerase